MKRAALFWGGASLLAATGCDSSLEVRLVKDKDKAGAAAEPEAAAAEPRGPKKPLVVSWSDRTGTLEGGTESIEVLGLKTAYTITLKDFAVGTKYAVGDRTGAVNSSTYDMVNLEVREKLGPLELDQLNRVDLGLELSLTLADGRQGKVKLPPVYFDYGLREVLRGAENGPVLFGKEPDDAQSDNCLLWPTGSEIEKYGLCTTVQTVDWIAVEHVLPEEKSRKVCTGYKGNDDKPMPDLTVVRKDTEVVIYERRTGKIVDKRSFAADQTCPMFAMTSKSDEGTKDAYADTDAIKAWLRGKPKR